jgi:WD40 repeat protein
VNTLVGHVSRVNSVAFDSNFIVSGGKDGVVNLWDVRTEKPVTLDGNAQAVQSVAFDDQRVIG